MQPGSPPSDVARRRRLARGLLAEGATDPSQPLPHRIYRLVPGTSVWQELGEAPPQAVVYSATPGSGALWSLPQSEGVGDYPQDVMLITSYP